MDKFDLYFFNCGVIDCFNEIVHAGVKRLALSRPCSSKKERDEYRDFVKVSCEDYGTKYYAEDEPFLTDLFPVSMNRRKFNFVLYSEDSALAEYLALKDRRKALIRSREYKGEARKEIAVSFGRLLSYSEEAIERMIGENREKE